MRGGACAYFSVIALHGCAELLLRPAAALVSGCSAVACGAEYTVWLCAGKLYSAGHPQYGQLGHGTDHEYNAKDCTSTFSDTPPNCSALTAQKNDRMIHVANATSACSKVHAFCHLALSASIKPPFETR